MTNIQNPIFSYLIHSHKKVIVYFTYLQIHSNVNLVKFGRKIEQRMLFNIVYKQFKLVSYFYKVGIPYRWQHDLQRQSDYDWSKQW